MYVHKTKYVAPKYQSKNFDHLYPLCATCFLTHSKRTYVGAYYLCV